jgi:hypothetical protein
MPRRSLGREWAPLIASVAVRLHVSPETVRSMRWIDFREVLRCFGAKVQKTPQELSDEIARFINGSQEHSNRNRRR